MVDHVGATECSIVKRATVETLIGPLAAGGIEKLDINVAIRAWVNGYMNDSSVATMHLELDLVVHLLDPVWAVLVELPVHLLAT